MGNFGTESVTSRNGTISLPLKKNDNNGADRSVAADTREELVEKRDERSRFDSLSLYYQVSYVNAKWRGETPNLEPYLENGEDNEVFLEQSVGLDLTQFARDLKLFDLVFTYRDLTRVFYSNISDANEYLERLNVDNSYHLQFRPSYDYDSKYISLYIQPGFRLNIFPYKLFDYGFNPNMTRLASENEPAIKNFITGGPEIDAKIDFKISLTQHSSLFLGAEAKLATLFTNQTSPLIEAQQMDEDEVPINTDNPFSQWGNQNSSEFGQLESDPLVSYLFMPQASLLTPYGRIGEKMILGRTRISVGGVIGDDPISTSDNGLWPLKYFDSNDEVQENGSTGRYAFSLDLSTALYLGGEDLEYGFKVPLSFRGKFGTYISIQSELGVEFNPRPISNNIPSVGLLFNYSHFDNRASGIEEQNSDSFTFGLRTNY